MFLPAICRPCKKLLALLAEMDCLIVGVGGGGDDRCAGVVVRNVYNVTPDVAEGQKAAAAAAELLRPSERPRPSIMPKVCSLSLTPSAVAAV